MAIPASYKVYSDQSQSISSSNKKKQSKFAGAFKKVGQYLQQQAQQNSHSALYLSPRDPVVQRHINNITEEDLTRHLTALNDHNALPFGVVPPLSSSDNTPRTSTMTSQTTEYTSDSSTGTFPSMTRHQYASDNILQSYDIFIPNRQQQPSTGTNSNTDGYFIIFIHGGYFRDPKQTSKDFTSTISLLESSETTSPNITSQITGYASLNYRLSPHPGYPQNPSTTPPYTLNNAFWPDQPNDILTALRHIQSHYPQSHRYILSGHSVGATLSLIATLRATEANIIPPQHVMGICGIYDFPLIHKTNPDYLGLSSNAIPNAKFEEASPALYDAGIYSRRWLTGKGQGKGKKRVMLAHSKTDELVNWAQVESMFKVFSGATAGNVSGDGNGGDEFQCDITEIDGTHYLVLQNGEVARCFREMLEGLLSS